jgi:GTP-binding protein
MIFFDSPGLLDFTDELPYIEQIIKESDLLLFLVDDTVGITAKEQHILDVLRREKKQHVTILVVNKLDVKWKESETELALADYYDLGIANIIGISAKTERNLHALHDEIRKMLDSRKEPLDSSLLDFDSRISNLVSNIAIVGKPNA